MTTANMTVGYNEDCGKWAVIARGQVLSWHETEEAAMSAASESSTERVERSDHASAARFYWASAYLAMERRAWHAMRAMAEQARGAERAASPEGALLGSIFNMAPAEERAARAGKRIDPALAERAKAAVVAEMERHHERKDAHRKRNLRPAREQAAKPGSTEQRRAIQSWLAENGPATRAEVEAAGFSGLALVGMSGPGSPRAICPGPSERPLRRPQ